MRIMGIMGAMKFIGKIGVIVTIVTIVNIVTIVPLRAQATLSADTIVLGDTTVLTVKGVAGDQWRGVGGAFVEVLNEEWNEQSGERTVYLTCFDPGVRYVRWSEKDSMRLMVLGVDIDPQSDEIEDIADIDDQAEVGAVDALDKTADTLLALEKLAMVFDGSGDAILGGMVSDFTTGFYGDGEV